MSLTSMVVNKADVVTTIVTLAAGGFLTEVWARWRRRAQNQEELNSAITDLLQLHFELFVYVEMTRRVEAEIQLPKEAIPHVRRMLFNMLPKDPQRGTRYAAAVAAIARYDPVVAYLLRSRDVVQGYQQTVLAVQTSPDAPKGILADFDIKIAEFCAAALREQLPTIARKSSWLLWLRVRSALRQCDGNLPKDADAMLGAEFEKLRALAAEQTAAGPVQPASSVAMRD